MEFAAKMLTLWATLWAVLGIVHIRKPTLNEAVRQSLGPKVDKLGPGSGSGSSVLAPNSLTDLVEQLHLIYSDIDTIRFDNCCQPKILGLTDVRPSFFPILGGTSNLKFVQCDMHTEGGGWMGILLHNKHKEIDLGRTYHAYKQGFGKLGKGYWLGLDNVHYFTNQPGGTELMVELIKNGTKYVAHYDTFLVESSATNYKLIVSGFVANRSNLSDSLSYNNGMTFVHIRHDAERDNVAAQYGPFSYYCNYYFGFWWFGSSDTESCTLVALMKAYEQSTHDHRYYEDIPDGYIWVVNGERIGFDEVQMKIRPKRWECGKYRYPNSIVRRAFYSHYNSSLNPFDVE